jgi:hypothetical protein
MKNWAPFECIGKMEITRNQFDTQRASRAGVRYLGWLWLQFPWRPARSVWQRTGGRNAAVVPPHAHFDSVLILTTGSLNTWVRTHHVISIMCIKPGTKSTRASTNRAGKFSPVWGENWSFHPAIIAFSLVVCNKCCVYRALQKRQAKVMHINFHLFKFHDSICSIICAGYIYPFIYIQKNTGSKYTFFSSFFRNNNHWPLHYQNSTW